MKAINNFFEKAALWKVYIVGWFFTGLFMTSMFFFLPSTPDLDLSLVKCIKVGAMSGLVFGGMVTAMVSMMRKSGRFWDFAHEVESAETREELESIFNNEFQDLLKMGMGRPHSQELTKLYHIMKTKHKYLPE
jgi:DNA-binding cell septation regulator SpoVG